MYKHKNTWIVTDGHRQIKLRLKERQRDAHVYKQTNRQLITERCTKNEFEIGRETHTA